MTLTIRRLHATAEGDPLLIRLRLERSFAAADLHPPGMPPAAILCVRRVLDPLPGRLALDALAPSRAWEEAMRATLGRMAQGAARPVQGAPPDALAVRFEDRAELLACLARDWCGGTLTSRWWWRTLLRDRSVHPEDLEGRLFAAWHATPEAVPAALALLHDGGDSARFLARLPSAEVRALTRGVARTFGLPMLDTTAARRVDDPAEVTPPATTAALAQLESAIDVAALDPERRALYAAGVLLARAPVQARAGWPVALERWACGEWEDARPIPPPRLESLDVLKSPVANEAPLPGRHPAEPVPDSMWDVPPVPADDVVADTARGPSIEPGGIMPAVVTLPDSDRNESGPAADTPTPASARLLSPLAPALRPPEGLETRAGGLLFLLNLALHLELYGDFTRPLHPGIGLSPWTLLRLLGPHLLPEASGGDPLWTLLAGLAGEEPDAGFTPAGVWRVPRAWLTPWGRRGRYHSARGRCRLRLVHPAGFVVLEQPYPSQRRGSVPADDTTGSRGTRTVPPGRRRSRLDGSAFGQRPVHILGLHHPADTLAGWIERLAGYARARLALALGGEEEVARALMLPARIHAGDVRIDVCFSLNELPIAVRLAGLDRDPGWVPAAGRDIRFHFE